MRVLGGSGPIGKRGTGPHAPTLYHRDAFGPMIAAGGVRVMQESVDEELSMMEELDKASGALEFDALLEPIASICGGAPPLLGVGASVRDALHLLATRPEGCLLVVDEGLVVGIVTTRRVLAWVTAGMPGGFDASIEEVTAPNPETLEPEDSILALLGKLYGAGFGCVPVVDRVGRPLHLITLRDAFEGLLARFDREIRTTTPSPYHGETYVWGG